MIQPYKEVQHFRQPWLWFVLLSLSALTIFVSINVEMKNNFINGRDMGQGNGGAVFGIILSLLIVALFYFMSLRTSFDENGVVLNFFPLMLKPKSYQWADLKQVKIRQYQPLQEFGGWGIRIGLGKRMAYNVSGNIGLELFYDDGKIIMIGIKNPVELEKLILNLRLPNYSREMVTTDSDLLS